ncbi:hypothetical protein CEDDRAFT_04422, partial [Frankia sp. CeD]
DRLLTLLNRNDGNDGYDDDVTLLLAHARRGRRAQTESSPCSAHRADQPTGVTWTTIRRRQARQ